MTDNNQQNRAPVAVRERLDRLEGFLREDPNNRILLADAFETALACGEWTRAAFHMRHAQALEYDDLAWKLRESDFWLAQQHWGEAQTALEHLDALSDVPAEFRYAVLHNLAYIDFKGGDYASTIRRLGRVLENNSGLAVQSALPQLWLRALHRVGDLGRACDWAVAREKTGMLEAEVAGVASLIAFDRSDFERAHRWASMALGQPNFARGAIEAMITAGSLALAGRNATTTKRLADQALFINPKDGRSWSLRAFAEMLDGDLQTARAQFGRALATMPEHIGTWHGQGWVEILLHDLDGAQASFEAALKLDHNFAESHGGLAVVFALKQQNEAAQAYIERAMRLDSSNLAGRYARAILEGEVGDASSFRRFALKLLGNIQAPLGGQIGEWVSGLAGRESV